MITVAWVGLAIVASVRGAGLKPWLWAIGAILLLFAAIFIMAFSGMRERDIVDLAWSLAMFVEIGLIFTSGYFAITASKEQ